MALNLMTGIYVKNPIDKKLQYGRLLRITTMQKTQNKTEQANKNIINK